MRSSTGKIARLPADLRQQINLRLLDGQRSDQILPWLNDLPAVKAILAAQFGGASITTQNLSTWRAGGYAQWLASRQELEEIKEASQFSVAAAQTGSGSISHGAATIASVQMLKLLRGARDAQSTPEEIVKYAQASAILQKTELSGARLGLAKERLRQRDEYLIIIRDRDQRDCIQIALRVLHDARAKEIEASNHSPLEKFEMMGRHLFGKLWISRPVPSSNLLQQNPSPDNSPAL